MIGHVLLDTNVASFILKHDTRAVLYKPSIADKLWALSFQTVAELEHWAALRGWGDRRKAALTKFVDQMVIFNSDRDLCKIWGNIRAQAKDKGRALDVADAWIAATALRFSIPLVTHDKSDFQSVAGLAIISVA
ncbi:MAG: PIN domain-containing protein [Blastocatellia bacterium]